MTKLIILMTSQTFFLVLSQVFLKFGLNKISKFSLSFETFKLIITNYYFWLTALSMGIATGIWVYVLRKNEFSVAYPLISISYIFGLLAAVFIFKESVPLGRWLGVGVIILGIFLITKN